MNFQPLWLPPNKKTFFSWDKIGVYASSSDFFFAQIWLIYPRSVIGNLGRTQISEFCRAGASAPPFPVSAMGNGAQPCRSSSGEEKPVRTPAPVAVESGHSGGTSPFFGTVIQSAAKNLASKKSTNKNKIRKLPEFGLTF
jgi:hypothetical protein